MAENKFEARIPEMQRLVEKAKSDILASADTEDKDMRELEQEEGQLDLALAQERLEFALRGENPDIPVLRLQVGHYSDEIKKLEANMAEAEKIVDNAITRFELEEGPKDLERLRILLRAAEEQLAAMLPKARS